MKFNVRKGVSGACLWMMGIVFLVNCSGGGGSGGGSNQNSSPATTGEESNTGMPDSPAVSPTKHVRLSHDSLTLYVGESVDVTIEENKENLDLGVMTFDDISGSNNDFVSLAELNGNTVTVKGAGEGYGQIELTYIDEEGHLRSAAGIDVNVRQRGPEFSPLVSTIEFADKRIDRMARIGNTLYAIDRPASYGAPPDSKIHIIDISDISNPVITNSLSLDPRIILWDIEASDDTLFVIGIIKAPPYDFSEQPGIWIIDPKNPSTPIALYQTTKNTSLYEIEYYKNHLYLTTSDGMEVIDVADPSNPEKVGATDLIRDHGFFSVHEDYIYISGGRDSCFIFDIADPGNIFLRETITINPFPFFYKPNLYYLPIFGENKLSSDEIAFKNGFLFVINSGFSVVDITIPDHPLLVSDVFSSANTLELFGDYLLVGGVELLSIYDVSFFTNYQHKQ